MLSILASRCKSLLMLLLLQYLIDDPFISNLHVFFVMTLMLSHEMKPSRKKRQEGGDRGRSSSGTCEYMSWMPEVVPSFQEGISSIFTWCWLILSFQEGISSIFTWCWANGIVRDVPSIFGTDVEVVTTPLRGTLIVKDC